MLSIMAAASTLAAGTSALELPNDFSFGRSRGSETIASVRGDQYDRFVTSSDSISIISPPAEELRNRFSLNLADGRAVVGMAHTVAEGAGGARFSDDGRYLVVWGATRVSENKQHNIDRGFINLIDLSNPRKVTTHVWSLSQKPSSAATVDVSQHICDVAFLKGSLSFVCQVPLATIDTIGPNPIELSLIDATSRKVTNLGQFDRPEMVRFSPFGPSALVYNGGTGSRWEPRSNGAVIFISTQGSSAPLELKESSTFLGWSNDSGYAVFASNQADEGSEQTKPLVQIFNPITSQLVAQLEEPPELVLKTQPRSSVLEVVSVTGLGSPIAALRAPNNKDANVVLLDANVEPGAALLSPAANVVVTIDLYGTARVRFIELPKK